MSNVGSVPQPELQELYVESVENLEVDTLFCSCREQPLLKPASFDHFRTISWLLVRTLNCNNCQFLYLTIFIFQGRNSKGDARVVLARPLLVVVTVRVPPFLHIHTRYDPFFFRPCSEAGLTLSTWETNVLLYCKSASSVYTFSYFFIVRKWNCYHITFFFSSF